MGKTIVITGAGDGLGRALARRFAKDGETVDSARPHAGQGAGRGRRNRRAAFGGAVRCWPIPIRCARPLPRLPKHHPKIDVLINNAAVYEPFTLAEATDEQIDSQIQHQHRRADLLRARGVAAAARWRPHHQCHQRIRCSKCRCCGSMPATKAALELISEMWGRANWSPKACASPWSQAGQMYGRNQNQRSRGRPKFRCGSAWRMPAVGINLREPARSHYNSVTDAFRAVLDTPADLHYRTRSNCAAAAKRQRKSCMTTLPDAMLFIDGEVRDAEGGKTFDVIGPWTGAAGRQGRRCLGRRCRSGDRRRAPRLRRDRLVDQRRTAVRAGAEALRPVRRQPRPAVRPCPPRGRGGDRRGRPRACRHGAGRLEGLSRASSRR